MFNKTIFNLLVFSENMYIIISERFSSGHLKTSPAIGKSNTIPGANML